MDSALATVCWKYDPPPWPDDIEQEAEDIKAAEDVEAAGYYDNTIY